MRLSDWTTIYVTEAESQRLRENHQSTFAFVEAKLATVSSDAVIRSDMIGTVSVWFVSGSRSFLDLFEGPKGTPLVLWMEQSGRRKPKNSPSREWFGVSHETVGGSTTARGVFGREGLDDLDVPIDPLRRGISHILKYSIRPRPCSLPYAGDHYLVNERLSVRHLDKPVVYETRFSRSGWGVRSINDVELAQAFDLPPYLEWNPSFQANLVPIQMFRVVIDSVLSEIGPAEQPVGGRLKMTIHTNVDTERSSTAILSDHVWLTTLQRWMPGSWTNVVIADRAAKDDDAAVDHYPWNQRVSLVLTAATQESIIGFELLGLRRWRCQLRRSFLSYLTRIYGDGWALAYARFSRERRKREAVVIPPIGAPSKRQRTTGRSRVILHHDEGGKGVIRGKGVISSELGRQLVQDVKCGFRILAQVMQSSW